MDERPRAPPGGGTAGRPPAASPWRARFLWGVATAAHQIEGGKTNSDYWMLEHTPASYFTDVSGDANDSWHRWRDDLALVRLAGLNAFRFSVEWARIEPAPGEFSRAALDHYRHCAARPRAGSGTIASTAISWATRPASATRASPLTPRRATRSRPSHPEPASA